MKKMMAMLLGCLLVGCTAVVTKTPIGNSAVKIQAEEWDGTWACEDDVLIVKTIDESKGLLKVALIREKDGIFSLQQGQISLKHLGDNKFLNIPFAEIAGKKELKDKFAGYFVWAKFTRQGENLIVWIPDAESIKKLLTKKELIGKEEKDIIILEGSADQLSKTIEKQINSIIEWKHPGVYTRIKKRD